MAEKDCRLMAHWVAGYPDAETSFAVARALAAGGADYLEIQFPFSDPSADGPAIERASQAALAAGFTVDAGFGMVRRLVSAGRPPVFIMTYASLVYARGTERFVADARAAGARGLIVPDLPVGYDEGLFAAGRAAGLAVAPVLAPGMADARLARVRGLAPEYVYTALRTGITGAETALDADALAHLARLETLGAKVIAGFGVRRREQMQALAGHAHAAAVGSHLLAVADGALDLPAAVRQACLVLKGRA